MIIRIIQRLLHDPILLGVTCILILSSCSDEREEIVYPIKDKDTTLTFSVSLPTKASTYSLDATDENNVSSIYVLAFEKKGSHYELSDWSEAAASSIINDGGSNKKKFTTTFSRLKIGDSYKFVLLANAKEELDPMGLVPGSKRDDLLQSIQLSGIARWNVDPTDGDYRDIPMWGETSSDATISESLNIKDLNLVRMLARINVVISRTAPSGEASAANDYFKLKSVHLYNTQQAGHLVPKLANLASGSMSRVERPTLVVGSVSNPDPILYGEDLVSENALLNTIYTFENEVIKSANREVDHDKLTCLVIGGEYDGETTTTYYRVNIKKEVDNKPIYLDILRNHSYTINVVKIKGSGYGTPKDAFDSKALNMEAEIMDWNDGQVGEIYESDGYNLVIHPSSEFEFYRSAYSQDVELTTNHPKGWRVTKVTESDKATAIDQTNGWLKVDKAIDAPQGAGGAKASMKLTTTINNTGKERVGYVFVQFAKTVIHLTVTQTLGNVTTLEAKSNGKMVQELLFTPLNEAQAQSFDINWLSLNGKLEITNSTLGAAFEGTGIPATGIIDQASGSVTYTIKPTPFTAAEKSKPTEKLTKLDFRTSDGVNHAEASILIRHLNYGLSVEQKGEYALNGRSGHAFTVKSNSAWKIKSITESPIGKILNNTASDNLKVDNKIYGANTSTGVELRFSTAYNYFAGGTLKIVFESTESPKRFSDQEVTLTLNKADEYYPDRHKGWAGSNIYWDGSKLTFDDVDKKTNERYQGLYFQWGSLWGISPQGAWSSDVKLYAPDGTITTGAKWSMWPQIGDAVIPGAPPTGKVARDRGYLYELDVTKGSTTGLGDICKYITQQAGGTLHGKKWRMPTSNEFEAVASYTLFGGATWGGLTSNNAEGKFLVDRGYVKTESTKKVSFSASGFRYYSYGQLYSVGAGGGYWSSSPVSANGHRLGFSSATVGPANNGNRAYGFSVRCVAE